MSNKLKISDKAEINAKVALNSTNDIRDPNNHDIFVALSGVTFEIDSFDFGQGIIMSKTYALIFAPYMAAFKKPEKVGEPSPGPWKVVSGGHRALVHYEIHIPLSFHLDEWFDRLNTGWWLLSLIRMKGSSLLVAPVVSNFSFSIIGELDLNPNFYSIEFNNRKIPIDTDINRKISANDLDWVKKHWHKAGLLMRKHENFNIAFRLFDRALHEARYSLAIITIWGAFERLFADFKAELNYRVALNISSFLEPSGPNRIQLFKKVKKLYNARSQSAHGRPTEDYKEFKDSYLLLRDTIIKIIEDNHVPSQDDIENMIMNDTRNSA